MATNDIAPTLNERYKTFRTYTRLSWDSEPRMVHKFTHSLTQYTPSAYAELEVIYPKSQINNFLEVESIPIISRALTVSCVTEGYGPNTLYDRVNQKKIFGGPWRLICNNYSVQPIPSSSLANETNPLPEEAYLVKLQCVDRVWYSMTQEEKIGVFSKKQYNTISDCVRYILNTHQARSTEIEDTAVSFNWVQSKMTDYEFVRSVLAYANPPGFHFFCNNEIGYFKPIGSVGCIPETITVDIRGTSCDNLVSIVNKQFLEKVSDGAIIVPYGEGLNDSDHIERDANPLGGSSPNSGGKRYIKFSIDNEAIKQAFSANVSFRTKMFGRIAKLRTSLMTDYDPLYTIKVTNNNTDKYPAFTSGEYYVVSLKNTIGWNSTYPCIPHCWIVMAKGGD